MSANGRLLPLARGNYLPKAALRRRQPKARSERSEDSTHLLGLVRRGGSYCAAICSSSASLARREASALTCSPSTWPSWRSCCGVTPVFIAMRTATRRSPSTCASPIPPTSVAHSSAGRAWCPARCGICGRGGIAGWNSEQRMVE